MNPFRLVVAKKISPALKEYAEKKGIVVKEKEFIRIEPVTARPTEEAIQQFLQMPVNAVFTSANAVRCVQSVMENAQYEPPATSEHTQAKDGPQPSKKKNRPDWKIFCVEGATSDAVAVVFGKESIMATATGASALAPAIARSMQGVDPQAKLVFFCGNRRRDEIPQYMESKGIALTELIVYETKACPVKLEEPYDGIAFFSPSAVESFFSLNSPEAHTVCFSIGATTTGTIRKHTDGQVVTSQLASEHSLIESVIQYITQKVSRTKEKD